MTLLLTYHRTLPVAPPDNIHVLSRKTFARQIELIVDSGILVAPPADFSLPRKSRAHRLGLTFDDGYLSDLVCAETLVRANMKAIFFVSTANIGAHGYLDAEDIRELDAMGMTIGSHSHQHTRLTNLQPHEALIQAKTSKERLEDVLGKPVNDFAFPGGACSKTLCAMIREAGYARQYTLAWGLNSPLHAASGVFCRNCVVQGMDDAYFKRLISCRNHLTRRMHYLLKGAALQLLPETAYRHLRQRYLARSGQ
jgi:peptidoglycan/xylan/chitin deacetylase (PgdA/CDA1 family)